MYLWNLPNVLLDWWPYFSKFSFLFYLKNHHSKVINSKFQLKRPSLLDVQSTFVICSCPYFTTMLVLYGYRFHKPMTRYNFISIFQTEYILAIKFDTGCEENIYFLVIPKKWNEVSSILDWLILDQFIDFYKLLNVLFLIFRHLSGDWAVQLRIMRWLKSHSSPSTKYSQISKLLTIILECSKS